MKEFFSDALACVAFPFRFFSTRHEVEILRMELSEARQDIGEIRQDVREIHTVLMQGKS